MLHRNRALRINSLTGPGNLFTLVFIILAFGYGIFMTRGFTPSLKEDNPEKSQYVDTLPSAVGTAQNTLQLNTYSASLKPVNADCQQSPLIGISKPNMIYAVSPEPYSTIKPNDKIKIWYNDMLPMMIGDTSRSGLPTSPFPPFPPGHLPNPTIQFGDRIYTIWEWNYEGFWIDIFGGIHYIWNERSRTTYFPQDQNKFPYFPAIFVTDITSNPGSKDGDAQMITLFPPIPFYPDNVIIGPRPTSAPPPEHIPPNLPPYPLPFPYPNKPVEINGTWGKAGDIVTRNGINIGHPFDASGNRSSTDPTFTDEFPIISNIRMPGWDFQSRIMEYSTELTWNAGSLQYSDGVSAYTTGLRSGHTYRLQIIIRNISEVEIAQACINYKVE